MKLIDLTGQRFGRLTVIERAGSIHGHVAWLCRCDCGNTLTVPSDKLRSRNTQSCGCLQSDIMKEINPQIHTSHGGKGTRLYYIWDSMKARCYNPQRRDFKNYGGRGITVCTEWLNDFAAFRDWALSHGYADNLTIDRIDNDGDYTPENCRWVTITEQNQHKRPRKSNT